MYIRDIGTDTEYTMVIRMNRQILSEEEKPPISPKVREALEKMVAENDYMQNLQIEMLEIERGYVKGRMTVTDKVRNPYGSVHGGCLYSLADITAGLAACTYGNYSSTIDGNMEYILPAMDTEYIICEAKEIRQGIHVSQYEAFLYDDKGQLVDKAAFSFYMMNRQVAPKQADTSFRIGS